MAAKKKTHRREEGDGRRPRRPPRSTPATSGEEQEARHGHRRRRSRTRPAGVHEKILKKGKPELAFPIRSLQNVSYARGQGLLRDRQTEEDAHAHGEHGEELRADAAHDGAQQAARGDERLRHEAGRLLPEQELGRGALRRAGRERRRDGRHRGDVLGARRLARAAALHPRRARRRRGRQPDRARPRPRDGRGRAHRLHALRLGRLLDPVERRAPLLRDEREVHPRDRDRRHVPAPPEPQVLADRELHPGLDGRRADARHAPLHPQALGREQDPRLRLRRLRPLRHLEHLPHAQGGLGQRRAPLAVLLRAAGALPRRDARGHQRVPAPDAPAARRGHQARARRAQERPLLQERTSRGRRR